MFFKNTKEESTEVKRLENKVEKLEKQIDELVSDHTREVNNLEKDQEIIMKRKDAELDVKVSEKAKVQTDKIATLTINDERWNSNIKYLYWRS